MDVTDFTAGAGQWWGASAVEIWEAVSARSVGVVGKPPGVVRRDELSVALAIAASSGDGERFELLEERLELRPAASFRDGAGSAFRAGE